MTLHRPSLHRFHPADVPGTMMTPAAARALAVLRISAGFVFLWAFLDKTFGLGWATTSSSAWIHGGSPTNGFLASVDVGPFRSIAHSIAGSWWADWLFMLGLLGIGAALISGAAMRLAAAAGTLMLAMMWFAEFPPARHTSSGELSGSTNPLTDYHFVYAAILIVLALTFAGDTWGIGRTWARLPFVSRHRWLR